MPARQFPIVVDQGADYALIIPVLDADNAAVDVEDWLVSGQIRAQLGGATVLAELDVAPLGTDVVLRIPHATSSGWVFRNGRYDIEITSPDGLNVIRLLEGVVVVRREVTR